MRYFIELAYNGKNYHGWQIQPDAISIQEVLENALSILLQDKIQVFGAGRTDAGVHANQLYAHFDCSADFEISLLKNKLNGFLNDDIAIKRIIEVNKDSHARFSALRRTYEYHISTKKDPFNKNSMNYFRKLDVELMQEACKYLIGEKDFTSFSKLHTQNYTNNCKIDLAKWETVDGELYFIIRADRFLRNMVRAIVGTMINIGEGKIKPDYIKDIILSKNRSSAGFSVQAKGLFLTNVEYPKSILDEKE